MSLIVTGHTDSLSSEKGGWLQKVESGNSRFKKMLSQDIQEDVKQGPGAGFADAISKILSKEIGSIQPVLAKRKTPLMRQIEEERHRAKKERLLKKRRLEMKNKNLVIPDHTTVDYERQLRKIATRGGMFPAHLFGYIS